jgi:hypothetical protein
MNTAVLSIVFLLIIVTVVVIIVIYRLFGNNLKQSRTMDEWLELGYGYYGKETKSECTSSNGSCHGNSYQTITQTCLPHPKTGKGCIDNGVETFKPIVKNVICIPQCYTSVWEKITNSDCKVDGVTSAECVNYGTIGKQTIKKRCILADGSGINGCIAKVPLGTKDTDLCKVDSKSIATCAVGGEINTISECVPPNKVCGSYAVIVDSSYSELCSTSIQLDNTSHVCYSFIKKDTNGEPKLFSDVSDLYSFGYYMPITECVNKVGSKYTKTLCGDINCLTTPLSILNILDTTTNPLYGCMSLNGDKNTKPRCIKTCFYYNQDLLTPENLNSGIFSKWSSIIVTPLYLCIYNPYSPGTGVISKLDLTLNHTPCNVDQEDSYTRSVLSTSESTLSGSSVGMPPLSDCYANTGSPLLPVPIIGYDPIFIAKNTKCDVEDGINNVRNSTSTIFIIKPISIAGDNMRVNILAIQSTEIIGILYHINNALSWKKSDIKDISGDMSNDSIIFEITPIDVNGEFSILTINKTPTTILYQKGEKPITAPITGCKAISMDTNIYIRDVNEQRLEFNPLEKSKSTHNCKKLSDDPLPNFHALLNYRATRHNQYTCNSYYSYPPPLGYPEKDIGVPYYTDINSEACTQYLISK